MEGEPQGADVDRVTCETCGRRFASQQELNDHERAVHPTGAPMPEDG